MRMASTAVGKTKMMLFAAAVAAFASSYTAEGLNECLQEETSGVLGPGSRCTPNEEGYLDLYACDITDDDHEALTACVSVSPSAILTLDLGENSMTSIPDGLFTDTGNLKKLSFFENRLITTFPLGAFAGLTGLRHLDLGWMGLRTLPAGLFDDVKKLQTLEMEEQGSVLTELPDGMFEGLTRLRRLGLNSNGLTALPAGIFSSNARLSHLNLADNPLTSLPSTIFNGLERVHEINLTQGNRPLAEYDDEAPHLTSLPAGLFAGLKRLKRLSVRGNLLTTLPEDLFADTWRLKEISFANNELVELPEDTFLDLPSLITLDMSGNIDLQCKYEVDTNALEGDIEWPEQLADVAAGDCLP